MTCHRILALLVAVTILFSSVQVSNSAQSRNSNQSDISKADLAKANKLADQISATEWLGPMAPIALSPFFGITCLSAMSIYGQDTFIADNQFISNNPVLNNQAVFWTFLVLTLLTSLPRLTKVSKPIAQVLDQLETYSGIVTIIVIRLLATADVDPTTSPDVVQMGILSVTSDLLLMVAAAINIFVINLVKFFFESLIWITPFPSIDAIFEVCNKTICVMLMVIYAWSPLAATILNLILFVICAILFRWVYRSTIYMRTMLTDPVWKLLSKKYGDFESHDELVVFPQENFDRFPKKTRLVIRRSEKGWTLEYKRFPWFATQVVELESSTTQIELKPGLLLNKLIVSGEHECKLIFSRRYSHQLDTVANTLKFGYSTAASSTTTAIA